MKEQNAMYVMWFLSSPSNFPHILTDYMILKVKLHGINWLMNLVNYIKTRHLHPHRLQTTILHATDVHASQL